MTTREDAMDSLRQTIEVMNTRMTDMNVRLGRIEERLSIAAVRDGEIRLVALETHVTKSKAYIAGVASTFSFLGAALALAGKYIVSWFTGHQ